MKLNDLCGNCIPNTYNPNKYDDYGELIKPKLCDDDIIEKSIITNVLVHQLLPFDNMMETNDSLFNTKNKIYCEEK